MESAFPEVGISEVRSLWSDVIVWLAREKRLMMPDPAWHGQHGRAAICAYATPSCFMARDFPGYCCVGINMPGDAFTHLTNPSLRYAGTI